MEIIIPLIVIVFLAFIANEITKKLFPHWTGSVLEYTFTGFLFSVEVIVINLALYAFTLALYAFSEVKNEAAEGAACMYAILGMPTSLIGIIFSPFFQTNITVTILVFMACMIINCSGIGFLIGCLKKLVKR